MGAEERSGWKEGDIKRTAKEKKAMEMTPRFRGVFYGGYPNSE